ncbi:prenyltransferase/squalene oxidase repeat-containing protein [Streptomyces sp. NPDC047017]|uniref:prenyltransferase/squalene oxidase repeat-containing protein n=1 Tax=Streptomyces sp. NPDC047017 TaxID=3155024 RepID=UPI003405D64B
MAGGCTATKGAVVAVDFKPFGGTVERGCDPTPTTGYDLLHDAGFTTTGTQHDGPAFICRIGYGGFDSGTQYPTPAKEPCVLTPPVTAYWSYWIASPGQHDWTYSPYGAMARKLKDGDVDAWVFGGTDIGGTKGRPSFTPDAVRAGGGTPAPSGTPGPTGTSGPTGTPGPSGSPTGAPTTLDTAAAAKWLRGGLTDEERVVDDGAGTPDYLLTSEVAYGLAAGDPDRAILDKVTAFLAAHTGDYAYPNGPGQAPDASAAARLALLAEITGGDPHAFGGHDLVGDLMKNVCAAGPASGSPTPGCTAAGDFHDAGYADGQALAVLAVLRAGVTPPAAAVDRLTQVQCADGGITSILIGPGEYCDGDPATTGVVALALHGAGGHEDAVARARAYLDTAQRADGAFPGYTGATTGSVYATAYAAQALRALGDTGRADAAVAWLAGQQFAGGGFGFEEGVTEPALYPTPAAVLAGAHTSLAALTAKPADPTGSASPSGSAPASASPSGSASASASDSASPSGSASPSASDSASPTTSASATGSASPTGGPSPSGGASPSGSASTSASPSSPPVTPAPGDGPDLDKGAAYLTSPANLRQGHYYPVGPGTTRADFGLTIDGAYALAATGRNTGKLRGIVDFLDHGGKDGDKRTVNDWTGIGTAYAGGGSLGKTALLAEAVGRDPRHFAGHDLIAALDKAVCARASTAPDRSCAAEGAYTYAPSVFSQALAVMAQLRAGEKSAAARPIAYLESLEQGSGAWPSLIPPTGDQDVDSTAIAAMALHLAGGDKADRAVGKALAWIAARQLPDGGFPGAAGDSVNSAALAVQGLSLDAGKYGKQIARARAFLAAQQNTDGGFNVAKDGQRGSDLRASTQAVGGATGVSFGTLTRSLAGTAPQPDPTPLPTASASGGAPAIVTAGDTGGDGGTSPTGGGGGGHGGALAATGVQAGAFAAIAALLVLTGLRVTVSARRRAQAGGRR